MVWGVATRLSGRTARPSVRGFAPGRPLALGERDGRDHRVGRLGRGELAFLVCSPRPVRKGDGPCRSGFSSVGTLHHLGRSLLDRGWEPLGTTSTIANSVVALVVILLGATFFTNPVEILSERLGTPQEDVGTALPESVIAAVAILELDITGGEITRGTDIGIGAILSTP